MDWDGRAIMSSYWIGSDTLSFTHNKLTSYRKSVLSLPSSLSPSLLFSHPSSLFFSSLPPHHGLRKTWMTSMERSQISKSVFCSWEVDGFSLYFSLSLPCHFLHPSLSDSTSDIKWPCKSGLVGSLIRWKGRPRDELLSLKNVNLCRWQHGSITRIRKDLFHLVTTQVLIREQISYSYSH